MSYFAGFGGVAMFLAAGLGLTVWMPSLRRRAWLARSAYAYALGVAWIAGGAWFLSHAFGCSLRRTLFLSLLLPPVIAGIVATLVRRRGGEPAADGNAKPRTSLRREPLVLVALAVGALVSLGLFADAAGQPMLQFDDRVTWGAHARYLRAEHTVDARTIREGKWFVTLPRYPILLPLAQVAVQESFATDEDERVPRPLYAAFFPALLLILFDAVALQSGRQTAALIVLGTALWPILIVDHKLGALSMLSDLPLGVFLGGGLALLLAEDLTLATGAAAGILLGATVLSKNEGLVWSASVLAAGGLAAFLRWRREPSPRALLRREVASLAIALLGVAAAAALFISWRSGIVDRMMGDFEEVARSGHLLAAMARGAIERWPGLVHTVFERVTDRQQWGFFWWAAALVLVAGARGLVNRRALPLLVVLAGCWGGYLSALAITEWTPKLQMALTLDRFLIQTSVPLLLLLALALEDVVANGIRPTGRAARGSNPESPGPPPAPHP